MSPDEVSRLLKSVQDIKDLLLGTYTEEGLVRKVDSHDTWIKEQRNSHMSLVNYAYKVVIMLALSYIAIRIGIK